MIHLDPQKHICIQSRESLTQEKHLKRSSMRRQALLTGCRAQPDRHTNQPTLYMLLAPFIPLSFCFPTLVPSQATQILPCPHPWFLPQTPHSKSCAIPRCSSSASHNVSRSPEAVIYPPWSVRAFPFSSGAGCPPGPWAEGPLGQP